MMNWTEGNLSRHSRGRQRNELLARQKQHFAKARNSLPKNSVRQSPISISFLGNPYSRDSGFRDDSERTKYNPPSSPLLTEKRKWTRNPLDDVENLSSPRAKRKRLLDKADWVGLNLQQPIDITFPSQLQTSTGSRWGKVEHPRLRMIRKHHEDLVTPQLKTGYNSHSPPFKIQIGGPEVLPSVSTLCQSKIKRYSLVPHPIANSSRRKSNLASSPELSQSQHPKEVPQDGRLSQTQKNEQYIIGSEQGDTRPRVVKKYSLPEEPTRVVYSSSILHEPAPLRANNFTILRWTPSDSDDQGSMKVEVDRPARPISLSQEADQEFWRNVASTSSIVEPVSNLSNSPITLSAIDSRTDDISSHLQRRPRSQGSSSETILRLQFRYPEPSTEDQEPQTVASQGRQSFEANTNHDQIEPQPDDNAVWMKFVFSGDSDELEARAFAEAARQAAAELQPSDTSTSSDGAVETLATYGADSLASDGDRDGSISPRNSDESHMATHGTVASESTPSNIATVGSTSLTVSEPRFRFAQPRAFIGKFAESTINVANGSHTLSHNRKRRGRPRKRAADGRADIRKLPDINGDPIEEFEDD
ncbi:hypothetical protein F5Y11DRAFT_338080 [Daldinia sp. FL1419]|nr:hypothetical protein F5Y11DRAFT_338080 [Daldinia sp. FL1419]